MFCSLHAYVIESFMAVSTQDRGSHSRPRTAIFRLRGYNYVYELATLWRKSGCQPINLIDENAAWHNRYHHHHQSSHHEKWEISMYQWVDDEFLTSWQHLDRDLNRFRRISFFGKGGRNVIIHSNINMDTLLWYVHRWIHPKQEERKVHKGRLTSHSTDPAGVAKGFFFIFLKRNIYIYHVSRMASFIYIVSKCVSCQFM